MGKYDRTEEQDMPIVARVTANLLDNSRKYGGRENVRVAISARAAGEQAELAFTDNGPGVPPEQLPPSTGETPPTPSCFRRCGVWAIAWAGRQDKTENAHGAAGKARRERFVSCLV